MNLDLMLAARNRRHTHRSAWRNTVTQPVPGRWLDGMIDATVKWATATGNTVHIPLEYRPPELWIDLVHDAVGGGE